MPRGQEFGGLRPLFRTHGGGPHSSRRRASEAVKKDAIHSSASRLTPEPPPRSLAPRGTRGYIGQLGIGLSGSYRQGYSTAYNAQSRIKVVCNGYILTRIQIVIHGEDPRIFRPRPSPPSRMTRGPRAYLYSCNKREGKISPLSGTDSDLEAFSHYPADGSFAALPGRAAAKTNYLNQRFLSY